MRFQSNFGLFCGSPKATKNNEKASIGVLSFMVRNKPWLELRKCIDGKGIYLPPFKDSTGPYHMTGSFTQEESIDGPFESSNSSTVDQKVEIRQAKL